MRTSIIASVLAFTASQVLAQDPYYANQTAPFNLILISKNSTINGSALTACHEGAAIEGLCVSTAFVPPLSSSQYFLNYSATAQVDPTFGIVGLLTWNLNVGFNVSSPMKFVYNDATNVAVPLFYPADSGTQVGFDKDDKMLVAGYYWDDTTNPGTYDPEPLYRWYVCTTNVGYVYQTLAWVMGVQSPQNPTCQKVDVKRVFV